MIHDEDAMNYLMENKDKPAYIWSSFKKEFSGERLYDFSLIEHLRKLHEENVQGQLDMEKYVIQALPADEKGSEVENDDSSE